MSGDKSVSLLRASRRRPDHRGEDAYDGVQVAVKLDYLKGEPIVMARVSDQEALRLAAEVIGAVHARMAHP